MQGSVICCLGNRVKELPGQFGNIVLGSSNLWCRCEGVCGFGDDVARHQQQTPHPVVKVTKCNFRKQGNIQPAAGVVGDQAFSHQPLQGEPDRDRTSVVSGKSVSVRPALGRRRTLHNNHPPPPPTHPPPPPPPPPPTHPPPPPP